MPISIGMASTTGEAKNKPAWLKWSVISACVLLAGTSCFQTNSLAISAQSPTSERAKPLYSGPDHPIRSALPPSSRVLRDVAYGPNGAQVMDIYLPSHPNGAPVILMVHGGAWTMGDKALGRVVINKIAYWLPKGYIFISVDYRLLPTADPLEQVRDVARALAFGQRHATSWGGDPSRIVLMGHSSGAHLVDLLAADPSLAIQCGAKPWLGTVSLDTATVDLEETMQKKHYRFYDNAFGSNPSYWAATSPMHRLTKAPRPILLVCSTTRPDHPCPQAERFAAKVRSMGGQASVLPVPLRHSEINENLGLPGSYTEYVQSFLCSLGLP